MLSDAPACFQVRVSPVSARSVRTLGPPADVVVSTVCGPALSLTWIASECVTSLEPLNYIGGVRGGEPLVVDRHGVHRGIAPRVAAPVARLAAEILTQISCPQVVHGERVAAPAVAPACSERRQRGVITGRRGARSSLFEVHVLWVVTNVEMLTSDPE